MADTDAPLPWPACPLPHPPGDVVLLAHGEGARLTRRLIRELALPLFDNEYLRPLADAAFLPELHGPLVLTTDSYVVSPLFFPGGDIGQLAVHGTVNDLAVTGADPLYLTLALIIEEGLPLATLRAVLQSVAAAAQNAGVLVVTGDTKVVPRGAADKLFLNTTGVGRLRPGLTLGMGPIRPGDVLLVSGTLGDHGLAVLAAREGFAVEPPPCSDSAPLHGLVADLLTACSGVRFLRDPTRGGVAAVLHEIVEGTGLGLEIDEERLPVSPVVRGLAEILGLDPLHVANEGKVCAVVPPDTAAAVLSCLHSHPLGRDAAVIGHCTDRRPGQVLIRSGLGTLRVLDEPAGAPLPRIC